MARKPGKYDHVIKDLPRLPLGENPAYQQKVEAVKNAMRTEMPMHASVFAKMYAEIREEKKQADAALSEVNLRLEAVSQLLFDQYEVEGVTTLTVDGRPVSCRLVPYAKAEDPEAYRQWCEAQPDLKRKMTLPWQTTNSLVNNMLANGEELPPGITVWAKQRFTLGSE